MREGVVDSEIRKRLSQDEIKSVGKLGFRKTIIASMQIWRALCNACRGKAFRNSRMPMSEYCLTCQEACTKILEGLQQ